MSKCNKTYVVRMIGGLGNQLFQLQYALNFQRVHGGELQIDDSFLAASSKAHESLAISDLIGSIPQVRLDWFNLKIKRNIERFFYKLKLRMPNWLNPTYFFENSNNDISAMSRVIIDGFWQNASYLNSEFVQLLRERLKTYSFKNATDHCVCVHVRRGDYLTNRHWFVKQQIVVPFSYYENAFAYFRKILGTPRFEIYTDDEPWATKIFGNMKDAIVISSVGQMPFELLSKMASYPNYIIANSTLSWWAAVASSPNNKQVVLPKMWGKNMTSDNYCCSDWIAL